jgi:hypothetical protein
MTEEIITPCHRLEIGQRLVPAPEGEKSATQKSRMFGVEGRVDVGQDLSSSGLRIPCRQPEKVLEKPKIQKEHSYHSGAGLASGSGRGSSFE